MLKEAVCYLPFQTCCKDFITQAPTQCVEALAIQNSTAFSLSPYIILTFCDNDNGNDATDGGATGIPLQEVTANVLSEEWCKDELGHNVGSLKKKKTVLKLSNDSKEGQNVFKDVG